MERNAIVYVFIYTLSYIRNTYKCVRNHTIDDHLLTSHLESKALPLGGVMGSQTQTHREPTPTRPRALAGPASSSPRGHPRSSPTCYKGHWSVVEALLSWVCLSALRPWAVSTFWGSILSSLGGPAPPCCSSGQTFPNYSNLIISPHKV